MNHDSDIKTSVCMCTYKRPNKLAQCLQSLLNQDIDQSFEVIVTDNDFERSGEQVVEQMKAAFQSAGIPLSYLMEPVQNIALARNRSLQPAKGEFVAFIDDDERASPSWLNNLLATLIETNADGVWGPVLPDVPATFPNWMRRSKLFDRPNPEHASVINQRHVRTSNALIKRQLINLRPGPFDEELGKTGGSDTDLFMWIQRNEANIKYVWAANAEVFERVGEKRRYLRWHLRRAYRCGWGSSRRLASHYGVYSVFLFLIKIIPNTINGLWRSVVHCKNIRYAGLLLLTNIANNFGRCGYFLKIKIKEYNG